MLHFGCNAVSGIFTNKRSQDIAGSLGLETLHTANYVEWANQYNLELSENILDENSVISVMGYRIDQK